MELLGMAALHLVYVVYASDGISRGGLFNWRKDTGPDRVYSLVATDHPRLPLFCWKIHAECGFAGLIVGVSSRVRRYQRRRPC